MPSHAEPSTPAVERFTYRSARSAALTAGLALAVAVETLVLHLWLAPRRPGWAWTFTLLSVATLVYLVLEYRAWGRGAIRLSGEALDLSVSGRVTAVVPRNSVAGAVPATWRALPDAPDAAYVNATAPSEPNVLVALEPPAPVRIAHGLITRRVARVGLHLDEPEAFVRALGRRACGRASRHGHERVVPR